MLQFEKLLRANDIAENDPELPRSIEKNIQKLRNKQKQIVYTRTAEEIQKIEDEIDEIDEAIMKALPDFFDIEDEAEENKKKAEAEAKLKKQKAESEASEKAKAEATEKAKKQAEDAELNKPATNDDDALDKLFRRGKTKVTRQEIKAAGFNTGFLGDLGPHGCSTKRYYLDRQDISQDYYDLIKK